MDIASLGGQQLMQSMNMDLGAKAAGGQNGSIEGQGATALDSQNLSAQMASGGMQAQGAPTEGGLGMASGAANDGVGGFLNITA
ncbi:hypothetical protein [Desulfohalovibrio reitneri]|uniref:hypothetical protein n=1 Tax=Desulfohalovibrio reitneri TaxID=1307759 RepID=UPI0004A6E94A|nr:hypothetical protein [Desulfohalovibrio reitneri]